MISVCGNTSSKFVNTRSGVAAYLAFYTFYMRNLFITFQVRQPLYHIMVTRTKRGFDRRASVKFLDICNNKV